MSNILNINPSDLLEKEMDRKDFLKHVGVAMVALTGVSALFKTLLQHPTGQTASHPRPMGYGSMAYGGQVRKH
jgi:hypothetical protein